jgi:hypothetical protein
MNEILFEHGFGFAGGYGQLNCFQVGQPLSHGMG